MNNIKGTCPCCGYKTFDDLPPGTYEICKLCGWEDDFVQFRDPDYEGGANGESLREAQYNFIKEFELDKETFGYEKDKGWKILSPPKQKKIKTSNAETIFFVNDKGIITKKKYRHNKANSADAKKPRG